MQGVKLIFNRIRFEIFVQSKKGFNYARYTMRVAYREGPEENAQLVFVLNVETWFLQRKVKQHFEQDVTVKAHTVVIPRRQFWQK